MEKKIKTVFMGTPEFGLKILQTLVESSYFDVVMVVTQKDKPVGRKKIITPPPVKVFAEERGIPVYQPKSLRKGKAYDVINEVSPQLIVVCAYGKILPEKILNIPEFGCINVHASLLPKYRGASPIQWAIVHGEKITGITIMKMDVGLDTGDILYQSEIEIDESDTGETLHDKLAELGSKILINALIDYINGKIIPRKQNDAEASYAPLLTRESGIIEWNKTGIELFNFVRGMYSWPGAYTYLNGKKLKIFPHIKPEKVLTIDGKPGEIVSVEKDHFAVVCGDGVVKIYEVQLEGKKRMKVRDFLHGVKNLKGAILGNG